MGFGWCFLCLIPFHSLYAFWQIILWQCISGFDFELAVRGFALRFLFFFSASQQSCYDPQWIKRSLLFSDISKAPVTPPMHCFFSWVENISSFHVPDAPHLSSPQLPSSMLTPTGCRPTGSEAEPSGVPGEQAAPLCLACWTPNKALFQKGPRGWVHICLRAAGQLAAGKGHCWGICSFDVLPCFVGPRRSSTTSVLQKPSISMMRCGSHSCGELQAPGQDGISRTPPGQRMFYSCPSACF